MDRCKDSLFGRIPWCLRARRAARERCRSYLWCVGALLRERQQAASVNGVCWRPEGERPAIRISVFCVQHRCASAAGWPARRDSRSAAPRRRGRRRGAAHRVARWEGPPCGSARSSAIASPARSGGSVIAVNGQKNRAGLSLVPSHHTLSLCGGGRRAVLPSLPWVVCSRSFSFFTTPCSRARRGEGS